MPVLLVVLLWAKIFAKFLYCHALYDAFDRLKRNKEVVLAAVSKTPMLYDIPPIA
jgi:hypothetical protein